MYFIPSHAFAGFWYNNGMIKKILLIFVLLVLAAAGLYFYFSLRTGTGGAGEDVAPAGSFGSGETILEPAKNIPESNVFKESELNPFEGGFVNPFE